MEFEVEPFAHGEFGTAHHAVLDCGASIVMKRLSSDNVAMNERSQLKIEKDWAHLNQLSHPNIMKMLGAANVTSSPFLVAEQSASGNTWRFSCSL